ncbi:MAG: hypothetical protein RIS76_2901, partial [Verrucomicrobiota bacterium]
MVSLQVRFGRDERGWDPGLQTKIAGDFLWNAGRSWIYGFFPSGSDGMTEFDFDVVVIGGGSAGFAAARTLVTAGARIAVVEGGREVGGLCILRGCMPTKALLHAAELRQGIRAAETWGIVASGVTVDVARLFARKDELIAEFAAYRRGQLEQGPWEFIRSRARFSGPHQLELEDGRSVTARHFVIATGSEIASPPVPGLAEAGFLTSDSALR